MGEPVTEHPDLFPVLRVQAAGGAHGSCARARCPGKPGEQKSEKTNQTRRHALPLRSGYRAPKLAAGRHFEAPAINVSTGLPGAMKPASLSNWSITGEFAR